MELSPKIYLCELKLGKEFLKLTPKQKDLKSLPVTLILWQTLCICFTRIKGIHVFYLWNDKLNTAGGVDQMVQHLPSKREVLSSISSAAKKKERKKEIR
jgi:uncharacterized protein involved in tolerance to divalent cations